MTEALIEKIKPAVDRFCGWLDRYGETSYDQQGFYASEFGQTLKALYYRRPLVGTFAVSPIVFCEAFFPSARRWFYKPQRFPIADAHYAMAFAFLAESYREEKYYQRAIHFLNVLESTRCPDYTGYGWGYPFNWQTRNGVISEGTPLITTVPYVYEAFSQVYAIDGDRKWLGIMQAIAEHALASYRDLQIGADASSCAYTPAQDDPCGVINASAYRAFLLTKAGLELANPRYLEVAKRNLNFVLGSQNVDGSWCYSVDGKRDFIDHFHTCFVLKALVKITELTRCNQCRNAVKRGVGYYISSLFDENGLPVPFSKPPRLTVYRRELYDYAECINLCVLLAGRFAELDRTLTTVVTDLLAHWQQSDGSFRSRKLVVGWDNVPMHRWAQAQTFRSLCFMLSRSLSKSVEPVAAISTCLGVL
jgi:hypothetical protein